MVVNRREDQRVLAIDPVSRGMGFAVLEGAGFLVDWGIRQVRHAENTANLRHVRSLLRQYEPDLLIIESLAKPGTRRCPRVQDLLLAIEKLASIEHIEVRTISIRKLRQLFIKSEACNKNQIALMIAEHFPELTPSLPPLRKPWMAEDPRMGIFDSVALALTYYYCR